MRTLTHFLFYHVGLNRANTQTTAAERDSIAEFARTSRRAVEIGVYEGVTTGTIAAALPKDSVLYAVDPFLAGRAGICWGRAIAKREARRSQPQCSIEFIEAFSHQAVQKLDGMFDFVFIDGDHSWDGISQDWSDWSPRIGENGIIALHDTLVPPHDPSVANLGSHKYFVEHIQHDPRFAIVKQVDSLSILRRISATPSNSGAC